jgi:hypothetical protein
MAAELPIAYAQSPAELHERLQQWEPAGSA